MSDANSSLSVEREQPGRFPKSRFGGVVWTRRQGDTLREIVVDEQPDPQEEPSEKEIADKFNQ